MKNEFSHMASLDVVFVPLLNVNSSKRICSQRKKTTLVVVVVSLLIVKLLVTVIIKSPNEDK